MIKFQGRSSLKQYMPKKPIKRGINVWVLGDSNNGYFSRFEVYSGRGEARVLGLGTRGKEPDKGVEKQEQSCVFQ